MTLSQAIFLIGSISKVERGFVKAGKVLQLDENVYYLGNGTNLGIIRTSNETCAVIDTGLDVDDAGRLMAAADSLSLRLTAVINTHAHADHFGGNALIVEKTGATVYASAFEADVMQNPLIEPYYLFGAKPIAELTERTLMGPRCPVGRIVSDGKLVLGDRKLTILPLAGHSPGQIGVLAEAVCFVGDALFSEEAWRKYGIVYVADVGKTLESLERLRVVGARDFVPSHAEPATAEEFAALIDFNVMMIQEIADAILHLAVAPMSAEDILVALADGRGLVVATPQQYFLTLNTLKAYLSYLVDADRCRYYLEANRLLWQSVE